MSSQLRMDVDFHELEVGDTMTTRGRTITESDLVGFSALTGDWHPQHADADWAATSQFGERIAHGMMVVSYAVGLVPFEPERVVALRGMEKVTFKRPTRMGETIRVEVKVVSKKQLDPDHGLVAFKWRILNQDGKAAIVLEVSALWKISDSGGGDEGERGPNPSASAAQSGDRSAATGAPTKAEEGLSLNPDNSGPRMVFL